MVDGRWQMALRAVLQYIGIVDYNWRSRALASVVTLLASLCSHHIRASRRSILFTYKFQGCTCALPRPCSSSVRHGTQGRSQLAVSNCAICLKLFQIVVPCLCSTDA